MFHRLKKKKKKGKKEFEGAPLKTKINGRHPLSQNPGSAPAFSFNLLVPLYTSAMQWMHFQSKKLQKFLFLTCMYFYSFYGNVACILRYTHKSCEKGDVPLNGTVLVCQESISNFTQFSHLGTAFKPSATPFKQYSVNFNQRLHNSFFFLN